jgi:hypothetical protein
MCQSQTGFDSGSRAFSTYAVAGYHRGGANQVRCQPHLHYCASPDKERGGSERFHCVEDPRAQFFLNLSQVGK